MQPVCKTFTVTERLTCLGISEVDMSRWLAVTEKSMLCYRAFVGKDPTVGSVLLDFFFLEKKMTSM